MYCGGGQCRVATRVWSGWFPCQLRRMQLVPAGTPESRSPQTVVLHQPGPCLGRVEGAEGQAVQEVAGVELQGWVRWQVAT